MRAPSRTRLLTRIAAAVPGVLAIAWAAGFAWFVHTTSTLMPLPPRADGIVALTGGADRVETALRLLADGHARILLVSGVGGPIAFAELARRAGVDSNLGDRVTLGRTAASTRGNAVETAEWANAHALRSLLVVTAGYHLPRALAELARALPDVRLYPVAVVSPAVRGPLPFRLLAEEYTKYLVTAAGLSRLAATEPPRRATAGGTVGEDGGAGG